MAIDTHTVLSPRAAAILMLVAGYMEANGGDAPVQTWIHEQLNKWAQDSGAVDRYPYLQISSGSQVQRAAAELSNAGLFIPRGNRAPYQATPDGIAFVKNHLPENWREWQRVD